MIDKERVLRFIEKFHNKGERAQVIECFTCGQCYWFAAILIARFREEAKCLLVYDEIENHFAVKIDDEVYDITGIVTRQYDWIAWGDLIKNDKSLALRIHRDCVLLEDNNE